MKKILSFVLAASMLVAVAGCTPPVTPTPTPAAPVETPSEAPAPSETPSEASAPSETPAEEGFSSAMVTDTGGVNDQSFNQSAWEGLQRAQAELGIKAAYLESTQESEYGPNLDRLTDEGHDIIWGVGYMMAGAIENAAKMNPDQMYGIVDSSYPEILPNVVCVNFRDQDPSFLVGYMAAKTTKTNNVGFVGGIEGEIISKFHYGYLAGVAYGAKELGKEIETQVQYANSFNDSAAGKAIASAMYAQGADIVFHAAGGVGIGVIEAAKEANKLVIGVDQDQAYLAPDNVMTSSLKLVGGAMFNVIEEMQAGQSVGGQNLEFGLSDGASGIPDNASTQKLVDPQVYSDTKALEPLIVDGTIVPPANAEQLEAYLATLQ